MKILVVYDSIYGNTKQIAFAISNYLSSEGNIETVHVNELKLEQLQGLATVTPDVFVIAMGVSLAVGIVASIYPAWQAALLQPTAALRRG